MKNATRYQKMKIGKCSTSYPWHCTFRTCFLFEETSEGSFSAVSRPIFAFDSFYSDNFRSGHPKAQTNTPKRAVTDRHSQTRSYRPPHPNAQFPSVKYTFSCSASSTFLQEFADFGFCSDLMKREKSLQPTIEPRVEPRTTFSSMSLVFKAKQFNGNFARIRD